MSKDNGTLFYNYESDRIGVRFDDGAIEDGLHCGQTMDVKINGEWIPTRIEMKWGEDWYLVGVKVDSIIGLTVRL